MNLFLRCLLLLTFGLTNNYYFFGQHLIAHYPFNGDAKDISGNNNNGQLIAGVTATADRFGNPCGALFFNGVDGFIQVPNSASLSSINSTFTTTCWFKIESATVQGNKKWLTLICKGDYATETPSNPQYRMQILQTPVQSTVSINTDFTEYDANFHTHEFEMDKWNFCTLVYDGNSVKVYMNAKKTWEFPYQKNLTPNTSGLFIGKDIPGSTEYFMGAYDELRIYNSALSESEISNIYLDKTGANFKNELELNCPASIVANTDPDMCFATVTFPEPTTNISCGTVSLRQIKGLVSGSQFPIGTNTIEYVAESNSGEKKNCRFTIQVSDKQAPTMQCANDTILYVEEGIKKVKFNYKKTIATDNCLLDTILQTAGIKSGNEFPIGETKNAFKALDISGNFSTCSFSVTVKNKILAKIDTPKVITTVPAEVAHKDSVKSKPTHPEKPDNATIPKVLPETAHKDSIKIKPGQAEKTKPTAPKDIYYEHRRITFKENKITAVIYDDQVEDFDTISVFFNDSVIVKRQMLRVKNNGPIYRLLTLDPYKNNSIIVKAWNEGYYPPNTSKIDFYYGDFTETPALLKDEVPVASKLLHSKPGLSSALILIYKN